MNLCIKKLFYRKKSAQFVNAPLYGEKNGNEIGIRLNTVLNAVVVKDYPFSNKRIYLDFSQEVADG
jgi:hypothetical protein